MARLVHHYNNLKAKGFTQEQILRHPDFKQFQKYAWDVMDYLVWNPGSLVCTDDHEFLRDAREFMDNFWDEVVDEDSIWDEMMAGGFNGLAGALTERYAARASTLKPIFIAVDPGREFSICFQEAMHAWVHGLDKACVILCWTVLESVLQDRLTKLDLRSIYTEMRGTDPRTWKKRARKEWIRAARERRLLNAIEAGFAKDVMKLRDAAVHEQVSIHKAEAHFALLKTRHLVERLSTI